MIVNISYKKNKYVLIFNQDQISDKIIEDINYINKNSYFSLNYGIFSNDVFKKIKKERLFFVIIYNDSDSPIGFYYNYLVGEINLKKIFHLGLAMKIKNSPNDFMFDAYCLGSVFLHENFGDFYITNLTSIPNVIGKIYDIYENVWPVSFLSYFKNKKTYQEILRKSFLEYVTLFFDEAYLILDEKRFVLKSPVKEMGFPVDIKFLSKDKRFFVNMFTRIWINHKLNEDIYQVGEFTAKNIKNKSFLSKKLEFINKEFKNER